jgi:hypothetical protein
MKGDALGSFEQLMAELKRLCAEGRTGTLFIATSGNHAGQIGLRNGVVVAARFRLKTGLEAARGLAQVRSARFTFMRDLVEPADPRHPLSSTAVLTILTGAGPAGGQADNLVVHNILTAALVEYLGPMAADRRARPASRCRAHRSRAGRRGGAAGAADRRRGGRRGLPCASHRRARGAEPPDVPARLLNEPRPASAP